MTNQIFQLRTNHLRDFRQPIAVITVAILLLIFWQSLRFFFSLPPYKLPDPLAILAGFFDATTRRIPVFLSLAYDLLITWSEAIVGFTLGVVADIAFAILFVRFSALERGLLPYLIASQTVPILAIAPLVVVGVGQFGAPLLLAKAIVAAYLTFFAVTVNVLRGFKSVQADALSLMRSYAASDRQVYVMLRFPASLPYLFIALKISATASVVGAIVAELPVGSSEDSVRRLSMARSIIPSNPPTSGRRSSPRRFWVLPFMESLPSSSATLSNGERKNMRRVCLSETKHCHTERSSKTWARRHLHCNARSAVQVS